MLWLQQQGLHSAVSESTTCQQLTTVVFHFYRVAFSMPGLINYATCLCGIEFGLTSTDETVPGHSVVEVLIYDSLGWWGQEVQESSERCWFQVGFIDVTTLNE